MTRTNPFATAALALGLLAGTTAWANDNVDDDSFGPVPGTNGVIALSAPSSLEPSLATGVLGDIPTVNFADARISAMDTAGNLISFAASAPQTILSSVPVTGLAPGERIMGIDYRPANGQLYALSDGGTLYTINDVTGAASLASTLTADATDASDPFAALTDGATFGFDFNPVPDRLRVIDDSANLRINVESGATITDSDLVPLGDYFAAAYSNSFPEPPNTALYAVDAGANTLVRIGAVPAMSGDCPAAVGNPNCGVVSVIGPLNLDVSNLGGFDIAGPENLALAVFQPNAGGPSTLYRIDLGTGAATPVGPIGGTEAAPVTGMSIQLR